MLQNHDWSTIMVRSGLDLVAWNVCGSAGLQLDISRLNEPHLILTSCRSPCKAVSDRLQIWIIHLLLLQSMMGVCSLFWLCCIPVRASGPLWGSSLLMPCVSSALSETGENDGPDTYETALHTYACWGMELEIACRPDTGLELFKYAWGPGVVALGHSSKCIFICMLSVIMKTACVIFHVWWSAVWGSAVLDKTKRVQKKWTQRVRTVLMVLFS